MTDTIDDSITHGVSFVDKLLKSEDTVEHHGVLGMHWGVRKARGSVEKLPRAKKTRKPRAPSSEDHTKVQDLRKKPVHTLTNKELRDFNDRVQLEKKYRELKLNTSKVKRGEDHVKLVLGLATTAASIYALSQSPLGKRLIELGKNALGTNSANKSAVNAAVALAKVAAKV